MVAFVVARAVRWAPGVVMIVGGILGGYAGAALARRVNPRYVRWLVLVIAWTMTGYFFWKTYFTRLDRGGWTVWRPPSGQGVTHERREDGPRSS